MKPLNLNERFVGRVLTRQVAVGLPRRGSCALWVKPDLRLQNLSIVAIATVLLACITPTAQAANLGRLFFTPEQRAQFDYAYARNAPLEGNSSPVLTVNGIVQKNGGARTVWVNGVSQNAGHSGERTPTAQTVTIPGKSQPVKIKVGQKILLDQTSPAPQGAPSE